MSYRPTPNFVTALAVVLAFALFATCTKKTPAPPSPVSGVTVLKGPG